MKKILLGLLVLVFLVGCAQQEEIGLLFKGIEGASVPVECADYKDDVCSLFDCMVDQCWCDDMSPEPILYETHIVFDDEEGAKDAVNAYIAELMFGDMVSDIENPEELQVKNAVKLNDIFYNVFVEDSEGYEITYTVAVDGTIFNTACGV